MIRPSSLAAATALFACVLFTGVFESFASASDPVVLRVGSEPWLATVVTPHDPASREDTYKVYTHLYDFDAKSLLTKGAGGKYTHHRGLFIGWKDTLVGNTDYDTWHMENCYQQHLEWIRRVSGENAATQTQIVEWSNLENTPFIREVRTISARKGERGLRIFDFSSELTSLAGNIELKGDLQHAGMQIRMADEVSDHEESTLYTLPEGAEEQRDDKVVGAWWVMGSVMVNGHRVSVLHMTPPDHPAGIPVYSIRRYARFGAFWEQTIREGVPAQFDFRLVVSDTGMDRAACDALYQAYCEERAGPK